MGACDFQITAKGKTPQAAFNDAREAARERLHQDGDDGQGYSGTIAEKGSFRLIERPAGARTKKIIHEAMADEVHFCQDKYGPAACINDGPNTWVFFGWAPS